MLSRARRVGANAGALFLRGEFPMNAERWLPINIRALPLLQQLNDWVIKQNEKRLPKWKFRFAPDFAIQIHPRITRAYDMLFECLALQTENLTVDLFTEPSRLRKRQQQYYKVSFELRVCGGAWTFKYRAGRWARGGTLEVFDTVRQRAIDVLKPERFSDLNLEMMLWPHCLCCGKGLTDPVSIARWIGPECWGSASTNLPHIFKATAEITRPRENQLDIWGEVAAPPK
jgi:hypothetical protein